MSEQPIVLGNPDQNTVALIFSWLNQNSEDADQDAEGDYLNIYVAEHSQQPAPRILLGGAASGQTPHPIFWRTRQVHQHISSREVLERYREVRAEFAHRKDESQPEESPEFPMEPSSDAALDNNCQWFLDSGSNSSIKDLSQTDSDIYKSSHSSDSGTIKPENTEDQVESEKVFEEEINEKQPAEESADVLSNPLLQAFIIDLEDVEMTPMLHMVANMMSSMYFNEAEAAVVRHYLVHKVDSTINSIQGRMDLLNASSGNNQPPDLSITEVDDEVHSDEADDASLTTTASESEASSHSSPIPLAPPVPAPRCEMLVKTKEDCEPVSEPEPELHVDIVEDNEGVTEASMKVVTQIMTMKSGRKRKSLIKKSHLGEKELAMVRYFEESMRVKSSWWNCCGASRKTDIPY